MDRSTSAWRVPRFGFIGRFGLNLTQDGFGLKPRRDGRKFAMRLSPGRRSFERGIDMAKVGRRRIWSANDASLILVNREIQAFGKDGERATAGSLFSGGGEGASDGPRRDPTEGDILGRKPTTD
jgi:hypothetical protein